MNMATISHTDFESVLSGHQNIQFCLNLSFFSYHLLLDYLHNWIHYCPDKIRNM